MTDKLLLDCLNKNTAYTQDFIEGAEHGIKFMQAKLSEAERLIAQQSKIIENYHAMKESEINNQQGELKC